MSHLCEIAVEFRHIDAVRDACAALGWTLHQGGRVRSYVGTGEACAWTIELTTEASLRQTYNLGLRQAPDGTYALLCDNAMRGPVTPVGQYAGETPRILGRLRQEYATAVLYAEAAMHGWQLDATQQPDGTRTVWVHGLIG